MTTKKKISTLRILRNIFILLFLFFIGLSVTGVLFLKTFDLNQFKPQILDHAQTALKRNVDFDHVKLQISLEEGLKLNIKKLKIADDPYFKGGDIVRAEDVSLKIDFLAFFLMRQIHFFEVSIISPEVTLIKNDEGKINILELGKPPQVNNFQNPSGPFGKGNKIKSPSVIPVIFIDKLTLEKGSVHYFDKTFEPDLDLHASQIEIKLNRFSLLHPSYVDIKMALLSPQQNIHFASKAHLNLEKQEVKLTETELETDFALLDFNELENLMGSLKYSFALPEKLKGNLSVKIKDLTASSNGIHSLLMDLDYSNGEIGFPNSLLGLPFEAAQINLQLKNLSLGATPIQFSLRAAYLNDSPNLSLEGTVDLDLPNKRVEIKDSRIHTQLEELPLKAFWESSSLFKNIPLPQVLKGETDVTIHKLVAGVKGVEDFNVNLDWQQGEVLWENITPGISLEASQTNLRVTDFSFNKPFQADLTTALFSRKLNLSFKGEVKFDPVSQALELRNASVFSDLINLPLEKIKMSFASLNKIPLPQVLEGKANGFIKELNMGPQGLSSLKMDVDWQEGKVVAKDLIPGLSLDIPSVNLSLKNFSINNPFQITFSIAAFSQEPNLNLTGTAAFDLEKQKISLNEAMIKADLSSVSLDSLKTSIPQVQLFPLPSFLKGDLSLDVKELKAGKKGIDKIFMDASWRDGGISFGELSPGINLAASDISLDIKGFSLLEPFTYNLQGAFLANDPNVSVSGKANVSLEPRKINFNNLSSSLDLSTISMDQLKNSFAQFKNVPLPEYIQGKLNVNIENLAIDTNGVAAFSTQGKLERGAVKFKELALPFEAIELDYSTSQSTFNINKISFNLGKGNLLAKGKVDDFLKSQRFSFDAKLQNVDLNEILIQKEKPVKLEGFILGDLTLYGEGLASDKLLSNLNGSGNVELKNGKLVDLNVLNLVISKLSMIPDVKERVEASLPEQYKTVMQGKDTLFKKALMTMAIVNGEVNINPVDIESDGFLFEGGGALKLSDQNYALNGSFIMPPDIAQSIIEGVDEFRYILDPENNIRFPLKVAGQGAKFSLTPDISYLTQRIIANKGKEELNRVLDKVFGRDEQPQDGEEGEPQEEKQPERELIEGILNTIFK